VTTPEHTIAQNEGKHDNFKGDHWLYDMECRCSGKVSMEYSQHADNLWVKWVKSVCIKGTDWWQYTPSKTVVGNGYCENGWLKALGK